MTSDAHKDLLKLALVAGLGLAATVVAVEFAEFLGFSFSSGAIYATAGVALLGSVAIAFAHAKGKLSFFERCFLTERRSLAILILSSFVVRLLFAFFASPFPDEYSVLGVLDSRPLEDVGAFVTNYRARVEGLVVHPPLGFLIMSAFYTLLPTPFGARIPSILFSVGIVIIAYYILKELGRPNYALLGAAIFGLIPHTALFLSVALTDVYLHFFGLLGVLMYIRAVHRRSWGYAVLAGIALGASFWTKQALGAFWVVVMLGSTFLFPTASTLRDRVAKFAVALFLSLLVFYPWALINQDAFSRTVYGPLRYVTRVWLNPFLYRFFSPNIAQQSSVIVTVSTTTMTIQDSSTTFATTFATTVTTQAGVGTGGAGYISELAQVFPLLAEAGRGHISYPELIVQTPLWLTPLVILFAIFGVLLFVRRRNPIEVFMLLWLAFPLVAMLPGIRDIRYLILFSLPVAYFAARGARLLDKERWVRFRSLLLAFVLVFLLITGVVAQQEYFGPEEASLAFEELGLGRGRILTNWSALAYYMPEAKLFYVLSIKPSLLKSFMEFQQIDAAAIFHQARASPRLPSEATMKVIQSNFQDRLEEVPSRFAWFEIFYNRIQNSTSDSGALVRTLSGTPYELDMQDSIPSDALIPDNLSSPLDLFERIALAEETSQVFWLPPIRNSPEGRSASLPCRTVL